jgi:hypothetical protein
MAVAGAMTETMAMRSFVHDARINDIRPLLLTSEKMVIACIKTSNG